MADFKPKPGSFLPYLESSERRAQVPQSTPASPLTLLQILSGQDERSLPLFDLQARSGIAPTRYAEALKSLRDAGYIEISGDAPEQTVRLTQSGAQVVKLARPA